MRVILASKSPRRREILSEYAKDVGFEFDIITREVDEHLDGEHPYCGVELLALKKGAAVALEYPEALVISSDTLVELDGVALGKPSDKEEALSMLRALSGRAHNVHTGVAVYYAGKAHSGVASTAVRFRALSDAEMREYVDSGEPMDKAGAYGIQGYAGRFVEGYDGDFDTVVGFSMRLFRELVREALGDEHRLSEDI